MNTESVRLDRPGAGLPFPESVIARFIVFPMFCSRYTCQSAHEKFQDEGRKILKLIEPLSDEVLFKRVLIKRFIGIEDSSRFWSPAMVLEHLMIVGSLMQSGIVLLSTGKVPPGKADTADVKPNPVTDRVIIENYRHFLEKFDQDMNAKVQNWESKTRYRHPWFGQLNVHQWICIAALHQSIHRKQVLRILHSA